MNLHSFMVGGRRFDIETRYSLIKPLGQGANGFVVAAKDEETSTNVAIKKIARPFDTVVDCKRTLREIKLLKHFDHPNVLKLHNIISPASREAFNDVYIVTDLMDTDLGQVLASGQALGESHVQFFIHQVLQGLLHIHSANVLHRDIKPGNLLINSNCDLKICDFGLARVAAAISPEAHTAGAPMTEYVATRWYRAPEIMLSWKEYTTAIDVWSVGCVFGELLGGKALFPGRDYLHQLQVITELIGTPSDEELAAIGSEPARHYMQALAHRSQVDWVAHFPNATPEAARLIGSMLLFHPDQRITVQDVLAEPYFLQLEGPTQEAACSEKLFNWNFEEQPIPLNELKDLIFEEFFELHPDWSEDGGKLPSMAGGDDHFNAMVPAALEACLSPSLGCPEDNAAPAELF